MHVTPVGSGCSPSQLCVGKEGGRGGGVGGCGGTHGRVMLAAQRAANTCHNMADAHFLVIE